MAWRGDEGDAAARRLGRALGRLVRAEDGVLMVFGLFVLLVMMMAAGLAVDTLRAERERARVQATLDRAVLAAADLEQTLAPREVVADYFAKAGLTGRLGEVEVAQGLNSREVTASAAFDVPTMLLGMVGVDTLGVAASARAEEARNVEISLVLDVSSSMQGSRLTSLRDAANAFVDTMIPEVQPSGAPAVTTISVVPYSMTVNVGAEMMGLYDVVRRHPYSSCVLFKDSDFLDTALPPTRALDQYPHFDSGDGSDWWPRLGYLDGLPHRIVVPLCPRPSESPLLPLSTDPAALSRAIAKLAPYDATGIDAGMRWGIAMLDPATRPVVDALVASGTVAATASGRPLDYGTDGVLKVAILMTDGDPDGQRDLTPAMKAILDRKSNVWYDEGTKRYSVLLRGSHVRKYPYNTGAGSTKAKAGESPCDNRWSGGSPGASAGGPDGIVPIAARNQNDTCAPRWYWVREDGDRIRRQGSSSRSEEGQFRDHPYTRKADPTEQRADRNDWAAFGGDLKQLTYGELFEHFTKVDFIDYLYRWPSSRGWLSGAEWSILEEPQRNTNTTEQAVDRLLNLCAAAKDRGILVFTIGFEIDAIGGATERDRARDLMRGCATSVEDHYFDVKDKGISEAFATIATQIGRLRLTR